MSEALEALDKAVDDVAFFYVIDLEQLDDLQFLEVITRPFGGG